jgi:hypothetical protein
MHRVQHLNDDRIIEVLHWGDVSDDDAREAREKVDLLIEKTGVADVLVDLREADSFLDTVEIYEFAADFDSSMRIAMLYDADQSMFEDLQFLETVAINRGNDFSMHASRQEAVRWLRQ